MKISELVILNTGREVEFLPMGVHTTGNLPLYASRVSAGFPSPADDYLELSINIGEYVAANPVSTFFVRVKGDSMVDAHIVDGAILAVDKSLKAKHNDIVICCLDGEFTVKRLCLTGERPYLKPENRKYKPIVITPEMDFRVWGVVVTVLHKPKEL